VNVVQFKAIRASFDIANIFFSRYNVHLLGIRFYRVPVIHTDAPFWKFYIRRLAKSNASVKYANGVSFVLYFTVLLSSWGTMISRVRMGWSLIISLRLLIVRRGWRWCP
jgi:hypothetical protein